MDQNRIEEAAAQCETQGELGEGEPYCNEHSVAEVVVGEQTGAQNARFPSAAVQMIQAASSG